MSNKPENDQTILANAGIDSDSAQGAVIPPIYLSTNYSFDGFGGKRAFDYARSGNPTRAQLGEALARLERGAGAIVTSSGMSAVDLALSPLKTGALVIAPHDAYGGTWRLFDARARKGQIDVAFIDQNDEAALAAALAKQPALVWIETPSNPLMRIVDVAQIARKAKAVGAKTAVDNTFLSPLLQKPLELGADIVVHSTTKYLNGHSDVIGGALIAKTAEAFEDYKWWANCTGVTGAAFDSWLTLRGLRTLAVRLERQQQTASRVAEYLHAHKAVSQVYYPGLKSHPQHDLAKRQQAGFGAMLSFELKHVDPKRFIEGFELFTLAESLGGVESLIAHPASMTHAGMSPQARAAAGLTDALFRLSIGLEHEDDLIEDFERALG